MVEDGDGDVVAVEFTLEARGGSFLATPFSISSAGIVNDLVSLGTNANVENKVISTLNISAKCSGCGIELTNLPLEIWSG